jgi:hypothetical protein
MTNSDELIVQYFRYLISDFGFHIEERGKNPSPLGNAFVVYRSSVVGIEITIDRNQVFIRIGDGMDPPKKWFGFNIILKYYAPFIEHAYEFPEYTPGDTWDDIVLPQLLSVSLITKLFRYSIQQEQRMIGSTLAYVANVK